MRIIIDIPEEFESDYKGDMFKDFFSRVLNDIEDGTMCGNYEKETAEMFLKAFGESIPMDRIVEQLEEKKKEYLDGFSTHKENELYGVACGFGDSIKIIKAGGKV